MPSTALATCTTPMSPASTLAAVSVASTTSTVNAAMSRPSLVRLRAKSLWQLPRIHPPVEPAIRRRYSRTAALLRSMGESVRLACACKRRVKEGGPVGSRAEPTGPRRMRRPANTLASVGSLPPIGVDKHADPICLSVTRLSRGAGRMTILVLRVCNRAFDGCAPARLSCGNVVRPYRTRIAVRAALRRRLRRPPAKSMPLPPAPRNPRAAAAGPGDGVPTS
ncbi:hypothetical protein MYSE111917_10250 [Mycobacterium senriense]